MWSAGPVAQGAVRQAPPVSFEARPPAAGSGSAADPLEAYFDHLDAAFAAGSTAGSDPAPNAPAARPDRREPIPITRMPVPVQAASKTTSSTPNDPFADWDPDLMGDPSRPARVDAPLAFPPRQAAPAPQAPLSIPPPPAPAPPPAPPAQAAAPIPVSAAAAPPVAPSPPPTAVAAPTPVAAAPVVPPPAPAPARVLPPSLVEAFAALLAAEERIGLSPSAATSAPPSPAPAAAPVITEEVIEKITARVVARLTDQSRHTILDAAERLVREEIERIKANQ
jgi:hypothetical protein